MTHSVPLGNAARLVRNRELMERLGVSANTLARWRREGKLPPPLRVMGRPVWRADVIEAWIASLPTDAQAEAVNG